MQGEQWWEGCCTCILPCSIVEMNHGVWGIATRPQLSMQQFSHHLFHSWGVEHCTWVSSQDRGLVFITHTLHGVYALYHCLCSQLYCMARGHKRPCTSCCFVVAGWVTRNEVPYWLATSQQNPWVLSAFALLVEQPSSKYPLRCTNLWYINCDVQIWLYQCAIYKLAKYKFVPANSHARTSGTRKACLLIQPMWFVNSTKTPVTTPSFHGFGGTEASAGGPPNADRSHCAACNSNYCCICCQWSAFLLQETSTYGAHRIPLALAICGYDLAHFTPDSPLAFPVYGSSYR